jgi:DNA repair exonuclease SbcCD ATPase subunit
MANIKKVIEIDVDVLNAQGGIASLGKTFEDVEKNTKSLKAQLREAITEVQQMNEKFGETSKEAINAAKRAAELKDKIEDANDAVQAFKGEGTFLATSKALSSVASGFGAVQGAMGLIGVESKDVQEQLLKVQSAMAVADGLAGLEDAGRSFKQLATVAKSYTIVQKAVTAAQWLWNAAMSANPIGAIVVVVTALIAAGYALVKMFMDSSEATKKAEKANIELNKSLDNQVKAQKKANQETELSSEHQLKMAKASGKSADEIRKLSVELANQEVAQKYANAQTLRAIAIEALRVAGLEDATEAQKETAKKALEAFNKANDDLKTSILNRRKLILDNRVAERQEQTDADKKAKEEADKKSEELKKKREEDAKKRKEELKKEREEAIKELKEFEQKVRLAEQEERLKVLDERFAKKENDLAWQREVAEAADKIDAEFAEKDKQRKLQQLETEKAVADGKKAIQESSFQVAESGISLLKGLFEKNKAIQKGLLLAESAIGIAKVIIQTQAANAAVIAKYALVPGGQALAATEITLNKISAGIGIAANVAATAKALASLGGGGSSGGASASSNPSGGGGGAPSQAPTFNVVGNAGVNQIATTLGKEQPPVQAFVVSKQMTNQQEMDRNIVKNATL